MAETTWFTVVSVMVAGPNHHNILALDSCAVGTVLNLFREPTNVHDKNAIIVCAGQPPFGSKVGYVPRTIATMFSKIMDNGYPMRAVLVHKDSRAGDYEIEIQLPVAK